MHTQPAKTSSQRLWFGKTRSVMMTNAELKPTSSIFRSRRSCWGHGRLIKDHNLHRWSLEPAKKNLPAPSCLLCRGLLPPAFSRRPSRCKSQNPNCNTNKHTKKFGLLSIQEEAAGGREVLMGSLPEGSHLLWPAVPPLLQPVDEMRRRVLFPFFSPPLWYEILSTELTSE